MMHTLWNFQLLLAELIRTYVIVLLSFPLRPNVFDRATSGLHCRWHYWDYQGPTPLETSSKQEEECRKCG